MQLGDTFRKKTRYGYETGQVVFVNDKYLVTIVDESDESVGIFNAWELYFHEKDENGEWQYIQEELPEPYYEIFQEMVPLYMNPIWKAESDREIEAERRYYEEQEKYAAQFEEKSW